MADWIGPMAECLYCRSDGPFATKEHVIPESLGNDDLILTDQVCDSCQAYFGKEVERYVLEKTPLAVWRVLLRIRTKKGALPSIDTAQPRGLRRELFLTATGFTIMWVFPPTVTDHYPLTLATPQLFEVS